MASPLVRLSPSGPKVPIEGAPIQKNFFWVADTDLPTAEQDGSPEAPFLTLQQAIDKSVAEGRGIVEVYLHKGAFGVLPPNLPLMAIGLGFPQLDLVCNGFSAVVLSNVVISNILAGGPVSGVLYASFTPYTVGAGQIDIIRNITLPGCSIGLQGGGVWGRIEAAVLTCLGTTFGGGGLADLVLAGNLAAKDCAFDAGVQATVLSGVLTGCEFSGAVPFVNTAPLEVDSYTDARMTAAGVTNTGGRTVIG